MLGPLTLAALVLQVACVRAADHAPSSNAAIFLQLSATALKSSQWSGTILQSPMNFQIDHALDKHAVSCNRDVQFYRDCHIYNDHHECLKQQADITWLASYPGSGNTWTRVLLETATGTYTGSLYHDQSLVDVGMKGEGCTDPSRVLVVKTHIYPWEAKPDTGRAIVLVRHPLNAVLSHSNIYLATQEGNNMHNAETQRAELRRHFAVYRDERLTRWRDFMTFWLQYNHSKIFVRYEDLVNDTRATLKKQILPFLGIQPTKLGKQLDCALQPQAEPTELRRNHSYDYLFGEEDYAAVKSILGDIPSQFGYYY